MESITLEYAQDFGALSMATESDVISAIQSEYSRQHDPYIVEVKDIKVGIDGNTVYHMDSGTVLDWFDIDRIHESIDFNAGSFLDRNGDREFV